MRSALTRGARRAPELRGLRQRYVRQLGARPLAIPGRGIDSPPHAPALDQTSQQTYIQNHTAGSLRPRRFISSLVISVLNAVSLSRSW